MGYTSQGLWPYLLLQGMTRSGLILRTKYSPPGCRPLKLLIGFSSLASSCSSSFGLVMPMYLGRKWMNTCKSGGEEICFWRLRMTVWHWTSVWTSPFEPSWAWCACWAFGGAGWGRLRSGWQRRWPRSWWTWRNWRWLECPGTSQGPCQPAEAWRQSERWGQKWRESSSLLRTVYRTSYDGQA